MRVEVVEKGLTEVDADLHVIPRTTGERPVPAEFAHVPGSDDASSDYKSRTLLRPGNPKRILIVGLGSLEELNDERLRVAAALAAREARSSKARSLAWRLPVNGEVESAESKVADVVAGTILASYRFDRFKTGENDEPPPQLERLTISVARFSQRLADEAEAARIAAEAANRARELQQLHFSWHVPLFRAGQELLAGQLDEAERLATEALAIGRQEHAAVSS